MIDYSQKKYTTVIDIKDQKKVDLLLKTIPNDVKDVIDIGCGNGLITNELANKFDILGVDINPNKLKFVKTKTLQSSCNKINRPNVSYDLVFSSELLEHLNEELYVETLNEFIRLSKKYILITVPNNESLEKLMVKCTKCNKVYNKNGHLRSFNMQNMDGLFTSFRLVKVLEFGNKIRSYNSFLNKIKHRFTPSSSWIPKYWSKTQGVNYNYCIYCGEKNQVVNKFSLIGRSIDLLNILFSKKSDSGLMALFERTTK